jgi:hypothetical protein
MSRTNNVPGQGIMHGGKPSSGRKSVSQDINVLALVKGEERYIFLYDDDSRAEALRTLGRFASDHELSFSWYDAAVLSQKVRNAEAEEAQATSVNRLGMLKAGEQPKDLDS